LILALLAKEFIHRSCGGGMHTKHDRPDSSGGPIGSEPLEHAGHVLRTMLDGSAPWGPAAAAGQPHFRSVSGRRAMGHEITGQLVLGGRRCR
jgi:hypothetical protein